VKDDNARLQFAANVETFTVNAFNLERHEPERNSENNLSASYALISKFARSSTKLRQVQVTLTLDPPPDIPGGETYFETDFIDKINTLFKHSKGKLLTVSTGMDKSWSPYEEQWFWVEPNGGGALQVALD